MKKSILLLVLLIHNLFYWSQPNEPVFIKLQDNFSKKNIKKYISHDTIIKTSQAKIHLSYSNNNSKPYLLLLHGMGANARTNWINQIKKLSKHYNLILPDLIYFGESSSQSNNYSIEFQIEQIREAILNCGIHEKLNIIGFSYGGLIAAMYNQLHQSETHKLIIIDGPVKFYSGQLADSLANTVGIATIKNLIVPTTINEFNGMKKAVISSWFPISKKLKHKILNYIFIPTKTIRDLQMDYLFQNQTVYQDYNYNLDKTQTLLIWGKKDGVIPYFVGEKLHKAFPNTTTLIIYPKAKHDAHIRKYRKLNKDVISFLK